MSRSMPIGSKFAEDWAAEGEKSPLAVLQALFMSRLEFDMKHPRAARMMCGELQQAGSTPPKTVAQSVMKHLSQRLARDLETAKVTGEVAPDADTQAAGTLFIGTVQGLVMQSLLSGNIEQMRALTPKVLEILLRSVERLPGERETQ